MDFWQTIVLALVQGLSEFLPISSSAHLILVPQFTDWTDQGLAFDVVVHLGTLGAIVLYYRVLLKTLTLDFFGSFFGEKTPQSVLAWQVLLGTIPVGLAGLFFKDFIELNLRSVEVIAYATLFFGGLLGLASWINTRNSSPKNALGWVEVLFIGAAQMLALIPGTSRSGVTITAALLLGVSMRKSIQFSFLLAIPVITLSTLLLLFNIAAQTLVVDWIYLVLGFVISGISAYATIVFFIKLLDTIGLVPFVIYRLFLGVLLLTI